MATFTGTAANETITPTFVSGTVTRNPAGSFPSDAVDSINGGEGNDTLEGGGGSDTIFGWGGEDILYGAGGNDKMYGDEDFINSAGSDTMYGGAGDDVMRSGDGDDVMDGGDGNDVLSGIWNADFYTGGSKTFFGGNGNDTLYGGESNDALYGGAGNDYIEGGGGEDSMEGGEGDDVLSGETYLPYNPSGADQMKGGKGNDVYVVREGDVVTEASGEGIDEVQSWINYTLGANVENLLLNPPGFFSDPSNGTGNGLNNVITGNDAANTLTGLAGNDTLKGWFGNDRLYGGDGNDILDGGEGADRMLGGTGTGNDTFYIDNTGDQVVEYTNQGTDAVFSSINYTLAANVENLTLTGTAALSGTGNTLANVITGNTAANTLSGLDGNDTLNGLGGNDALLGGTGNDTLNGGTGADRMLGGTGTGNDTFYVDNTGDQVVEYTNQGTDAVFSSIRYTLASNVENLTLTGSAALNGTGNTLANVITGNGGKNVLSGLAGADTLTGGANADVLIGGTGPDRFDFNLVSESTATARDAIRAGGGAIAFEGAGVAGGDVIDVSGIDANTGLAGNQPFVFGGTTAGHLSLVNSGTTTIVNANVDADAAFEFVLAIDDGGVLASAYKAVDFIL